MNIATDKVINGKDKTIVFVKNKAFDFIAIGIVLAMTILSLGVVELRTITFRELFNIVLECVPFYMAATMLSVNYYNKGVFIGKKSHKFLEATAYYSDKVAALTGEQLKYLSDFCNNYNDKALNTKQERLLRTVAITLEEFDKGDADNPPLKVLSTKKLLLKYDKKIVKVINKCKKIKIKGIHPNILLSNFTSFDVTDLGNTEKQLSHRRFANYAVTYLVSIFIISLIAVKDILSWGWMGAALTLFKVFYISIGAYMKYFNGYEDITVGVVNHINRKSDVLKEFGCWYSETILSSTEYVSVSDELIATAIANDVETFEDTSE